MAERMVEVIGWKDPIGGGLYNMGVTDERIIRCRDCEYFHTWDLSQMYGNHDNDVTYCLRFVDGMRMEVEPDGFCKWGAHRKGQV